MVAKMWIVVCAVAYLFTYTAAQEAGVVVITPNEREIYLTLGDSVKLNCTYFDNSSDNRTNLEWVMPTNIGVNTYQSFGTQASKPTARYFSELKIPVLKSENFGDYKCQFTYPNNRKTEQATIKLRQVVETKKEANFTKTDKVAILGCSINSTYESMEWLQNNTLVSELPDAQRFIVSKENHTLEITDPMRSDANKYIARFKLTSSKTPYDCVVLYSAGPLVLDFDKSKNLIEGDKMELQCKVLGYPTETVTWFKDGKELNVSQSNSRVHLTPLKGFDKARLVIRDVEFSDAGDYMCKVKSEIFNSTSAKTITVRVKDKLAALWPFLGIVGEVIVLCLIIFIYEKRRNKQAEAENTNAPETDGAATDQKEGLRHRNTQSSNPSA